MSGEGETITITEEDFPENKLRKAAPQNKLNRVFLKTLDFAIDKKGRVKENPGFTLKVGIPVNKKNEIIIPNEPTVMMVDYLFCKDDKHDWVLLENQVVLFGHGKWNTKTERWEMQNGRTVKETTEAWERFAQEYNLPNIGFVVSCNTQSNESYSPGLPERFKGLLNKRVKVETDEKAIRNEIIVPTFQHGTIVESFGEIMRLYQGQSKVANGKSTIVVDVEKGIFVGLENAILAQQIQTTSY